MIIRNEKKEDYRTVEELTRKAFWNLHCPGCDEHYLVHGMREHKDFVPELDFVLELDGRIVANIMYVKSKLVDEDGNEKEVLTFGPLSVLPEYQRKGYGKQLIEYSFVKSIELGYDTVVIYGNPENYISAGFKSCKKYNVSIEDGIFPVALLVKELREGVIENKNWSFYESSVYNIDKTQAKEFDKNFELCKKEYKPSQELFYIYSQSRIVE